MRLTLSSLITQLVFRPTKVKLFLMWYSVLLVLMCLILVNNESDSTSCVKSIAYYYYLFFDGSFKCYVTYVTLEGDVSLIGCVTLYYNGEVRHSLSVMQKKKKNYLLKQFN